MKLKPLDSPELIELVAGWLAVKEKSQGLDFAGGRQPTPALLKIMTVRDTNVLRVFTADDDATPIGVVGLNDVNRHNKTAMTWAVLGDKSYAGRGYAVRALSEILTLGFRELGLGVIRSWSVEDNLAGIEVTKRLNVRFIGRQGQCHHIDGRPYDRLWFDLLASEHEEMGLTPLQERIGKLILQNTRVEVPAEPTDLFQTGVFGPQTFAEFVLALEFEFDIRISIEDLQLDRFCSIERIAQFVGGRLARGARRAPVTETVPRPLTTDRT